MGKCQVLHAVGTMLTAHSDILNLFEGHPDKEFNVRIAGGGKHHKAEKFEFETWLYQLKGG